MKYKYLECSRHGLTLHRCKRKCWQLQRGEHTSEYTERCVKCIMEGKFKKKEEVRVKKQRFISLREE